MNEVKTEQNENKFEQSRVKKTGTDQDLDSDLKIIPFDPEGEYSAEIRHLYHDSFPDSERKPFSMLEEGRESGKMELFCALLNGRPAGLLFVIHGTENDVLDYLAVDESLRGQQIGTRMLEWMKSRRKRPFIVEIENTYTGDDPEAVRRKQFYLRNELVDCREQIVLFGVDMELMAWPEPVSFETYVDVMDKYFDGAPMKWISRLEPSGKS